MTLSATAPPAIPHCPLAIAPHSYLMSHTPQVRHRIKIIQSHKHYLDTQCQNGGSCSDTGQCVCPPGWSGERCEQGITCVIPNDHYNYYVCGNKNCCCLALSNSSIATCTDTTCLNGGSCSEPDQTCTCPINWTGRRCEESLPVPTIIAVGGVVAIAVLAALLSITYILGLTFFRRRNPRFHTR